LEQLEESGPERGEGRFMNEIMEAMARNKRQAGTGRRSGQATSIENEHAFTCQSKNNEFMTSNNVIRFLHTSKPTRSQ